MIQNKPPIVLICLFLLLSKYGRQINKRGGIQESLVMAFREKRFVLIWITFFAFPFFTKASIDIEKNESICSTIRTEENNTSVLPINIKGELSTKIIVIPYVEKTKSLLTPTSATISASLTSVCRNGTANVTLIASGGSAPFTFIYKIKTGSNQTAITTGGAFSSVVAVNTGTVGTFTYTLISVEDAGGLILVGDSVTITVNPIPIITLIPNSIPTVCVGQKSFDVTFGTINNPDKYSLIWAGAAKTLLFIDVIDSPYVSSPATKTTVNHSPAAPAPAGIYTGTIKFTISSTGCAVSGTSTVVLNPLPSAATGADGSRCGAGTVVISATPPGGATIDWYQAATGGTAITTSSNSFTTQSIATTTTYYAETRNTTTGCVSATRTAVIATINSLPIAIINSVSPTTFCSGGSVTLTSSTASTYLWSTGATSQSISINNGGNYSVTITNANGCISTSSITTVTVNPLPLATITAGSATTFCSGGSVNLTSVSASSYLWSTGATSQSVSINSNGNYNVTITNANGCTSTSSITTVTVNPLPILNINNPSFICAPGTVNLTSSAITSGSATSLSFSYFTDLANTNILLTPSAVATSGIYYIQGTFPSGCSITKPVTVSIIVNPMINITSPAAVCSPATINLTLPEIVNGSTPGLSYSYFADAANTNILTNPQAISSSGTYYIKGSLATDCFASLPVTVVISPLPNGTLQIPSLNFICDGIPLQLTTVSNAAKYQWYFNQVAIQSASLANYGASIAGNYTVDFISKEGCIKEAGNSIRLDLLTKPFIQFQMDSRCEGQLINLTNLSSFANAGGISWLWDFGDGSASNIFNATHTYFTSGNYAVTLTANNTSCTNLTEKTTIITSIAPSIHPIRYDTILAVGGKTFNLNARAIGINYLWQPANGLSNAGSRSPLVNLNKDVAYTVTIKSSAGCITTDSVFVKIILDGEIYVPQGFTPNGDGSNDKAYPFLVGIRQLTYFKVFNRWGNQIFQTNDASPQSGWDGKFGGIIQPAGTYIWTAEAIDGGGNIISRTGTIVLIN